MPTHPVFNATIASLLLSLMAPVASGSSRCCVINLDETDSGGEIRITIDYSDGGPPVSELIYDAILTYKTTSSDASRADDVRWRIGSLPGWRSQVVGLTTVVVWPSGTQEVLACDVISNDTTLAVSAAAFQLPFGIIEFDTAAHVPGQTTEANSTGGPFDFRVGTTDFSLSGAAVDDKTDTEICLEAFNAIDTALPSANPSAVGNTAIVIAGESISSCSSGDGNVEIGCFNSSHAVPALPLSAALWLSLLVAGTVVVARRRRR